MRKNTIHKKELISFLSKLRTSLSKNPENAVICGQITDIVKFLKSHELNLSDFENQEKPNFVSKDSVETLIWLSKIIKTIFDLINDYYSHYN